MRNSFTSRFCVSKELNIPPLSAKYVLKNGKTRNALFLIYLKIYHIVDVMHT